MRVAISQPNYLPWKGYFDLIASVDSFVLLDDAQFTRRDWRNRNRIKTAQGLCWLTIPLEQKGQYSAPICEMREVDGDWRDKHLKTISLNYSKEAHSGTLHWLEESFADCTMVFLHDINRHFLDRVCTYLDIGTAVYSSIGFQSPGSASERLLGICQSLGATTYVSGPAAKDYLDVDMFEAAGITVEWFSYGPYANYKQPWGEFVEKVSVIDVILNAGPEAKSLVRRSKV